MFRAVVFFCEENNDEVTCIALHVRKCFYLFIFYECGRRHTVPAFHMGSIQLLTL